MEKQTEVAERQREKREIKSLALFIFFSCLDVWQSRAVCIASRNISRAIRDTTTTRKRLFFRRRRRRWHVHAKRSASKWIARREFSYSKFRDVFFSFSAKSSIQVQSCLRLLFLEPSDCTVTHTLTVALTKNKEIIYSHTKLRDLTPFEKWKFGK